jgi:hypothetical protein
MILFPKTIFYIQTKSKPGFKDAELIIGYINHVSSHETWPLAPRPTHPTRILVSQISCGPEVDV